MCDAFRASCGEVAACLVRVPTEIIKQRSQTSSSARSVLSRASALYASEGIRGFYKGYWSTVSREIPFSFIEFPLWEYLKRVVAKRTVRFSRTNPSKALRFRVRRRLVHCSPLLAAVWRERSPQQLLRRWTLRRRALCSIAHPNTPLCQVS